MLFLRFAARTRAKIPPTVEPVTPVLFLRAVAHDAAAGSG